MSAREIIEQIPALPEEDIKLIEAALRARRAQAAAILDADEDLRREQFLAAKSHLFTQYGDLLEKLAQ
jgi:hypothetical protein